MQRERTTATGQPKVKKKFEGRTRSKRLDEGDEGGKRGSGIPLCPPRLVDETLRSVSVSTARVCWTRGLIRIQLFFSAQRSQDFENCQRV